MVFLTIIPGGMKNALRKAASSGTAAWCGADAGSEEDFAALKGKGLSTSANQICSPGYNS